MHRLRKIGLSDVYVDAGFKVGIPDCSYCVGMSVNQAAPGNFGLPLNTVNLKTVWEKVKNETENHEVMS
jgi:homoaconitase/3-isopropylmalate dehydratase large subunit